MKNNRNDANVLVIGGSYGVGRNIADALANESVNVVVLSRTPPVSDSKLGKSILNWRQLDLSKIDKSRIRLEEILNEFDDQLDAVFYSAVYYGSKHASFLTATEEEWRRQLNVNLHGLWLSLLCTLPILKQQPAPGLFVHLSSAVMYHAGPWRAGYAATKAAASNLMSSLAQEEPEGSVRLVQFLPAKMMNTMNVNNRCSDNFDYSDCMLSKYFQQAAIQLLRTRGEGMHGKNLVLDEHGKIICLDDLFFSV